MTRLGRDKESEFKTAIVHIARRRSIGLAHLKSYRASQSSVADARSLLTISHQPIGSKWRLELVWNRILVAVFYSRAGYIAFSVYVWHVELDSASWDCRRHFRRGFPTVGASPDVADVSS